MKLIPLITFAIALAVDCRAHEHFTFPPQFSTPHSIFSQDKSPYLPPESHTPIPYFAMKNFNLPFPYLPPSATRAPVPYPPTHTISMSSTYKPKQNDDDDDNEDERPSSPRPSFYRNAINRTEVHQQQKPERRELRPVPKSFQLPIDRIDTKFPIQFSPNTEPLQEKDKTISRSIVISDLQRKDNAFDHAKASSFQSAQYIPQNIFVSSSTETSIPILRLSNEMDLDGSFSYEALGADQTHYVQHSRMENMADGKEEQIVEGSYSYVGDNGKTYTVHYIADSNGFRAIGDHLPVAPPVPEIIQRAIQYNLAEEAKKPPSLKSWSDEHNENIVSESERRNQFAITPPRVNPLFTGKTPQSFSHSFSEAANSQHNMVTAASTQNPMVATIDFTSDQIQSKQNSGTISPQITFLASQGAHVPSANTPQQTIVRMFTTEKSTMPQLINYDANMKESDQEGNKALWRWQYGINANSNQNIDKTSISRSFGEDDVSINFGDMTQEQYTKMFNQELNQNQRLDENSNNFDHNRYINSNSNDMLYRQNLMQNAPSINTETSQYSTERISSTEAPTTFRNQDAASSLYNSYVPNVNDVSMPNQRQSNENIRSKLITQKQFVPPNQIVTQTYDYADNDFEIRKSKIMNSELDSINEVNLNVVPLHFDDKNQNIFKTNTYQQVEGIVTTLSPPITSTASGEIKFSDFIVNENKEGFKPLFAFEPEEKETTTTTTTENSIENMFTENIFLKNMLRNNDNHQNDRNKIQEENLKLLLKPLEPKVDKYSNDHQPKAYNEMKVLKRNPIDVAEVLNFMTRNNQFESSKLKSRPIQIPVNYNVNYDNSYEPDSEEDYDEEREHRNYRTLHDQEELRGVIKNYKVLHRHHNVDRKERDNNVDRFRNSLRSHLVKSYNLPPLGRAGPATKSYLPPVYV